MKAIAVLHNNKCALVSGVEKAKREGETWPAFYGRIIPKAHPDAIKHFLVDESEIPSGRIEDWVYNPTTDKIEVIDVNIIDWEGLEEAIRGIGQSAKTTLGTYYLLYAQAIKDKDEEYLKSIYASMVVDGEISTTIKETVFDTFIGLGVEFP